MEKYSKENKIPIYLNFRFGGEGYKKLLSILENKIGPLKYFDKKCQKHREKISKKLREKKLNWYYNDELKENKLMKAEEATGNWKKGRKKWD